MKYKNAQSMLPQYLLREIQQFMDGGYLYIPKRIETKRSWGDNTGIKKELNKRNENIYEDFKSGMSVYELSNKYYLVENSIRRILREYKKINK
ncbi:CD3324 family protein [Clostridium lamae]|uniref:CD3324 family protein n=1 Tax=Clostridium TaxID=1485 RepID=UPI00374E90EF